MYQATAVDIFVFVHVATKPGGFLVVFFFLDLGTFPIFARRPYVYARPNPT